MIGNGVFLLDFNHYRADIFNQHSFIAGAGEASVNDDCGASGFNFV
jgi:hypothetical protein